MTTLAQLVQPKTKEEMRALLLLALKGVGFASRVGPGTGTLTLDGAATEALDVVVAISLAGELGIATFGVSWDGGDSYALTGQVVAASVSIGNGLTLRFANGDTGESFSLGDEFSFSTAVPTLEATAWQAGSVPLSLVEMDAEAMADFSVLQAKVAAGGFLTTAVDAWLDLWVQDVYDLERRAGTATKGTVLLKDMAGSGPYTVTPGQIWVGTADGLRYVNTTGGTLAQYGGRGQGGDPAGLTLTVQADRVGAEHNVAGLAINTMFTPLPGVTVSNPNGSSTWVTLAGTNRETDAELRARATSRWPALGVGATADGYDLWARETPVFGASVTRTLVRNHPSVPGTVQLYLAGGAGPVSGGVVTGVQEYVEPFVPLTSLVEVASAIAYPYTVQGTLYVATGYGAAAKAAVDTNLAALNGGGRNTGGEVLPGIPIGGTVYLSAIIEELMRAPGARNASLTSPAGDIPVGATDVPVLTCETSLDPLDTPDLLIVEV